MGGPKGPLRGPKTHRADLKLNRGEHREPEPKPEKHADEDELSRHEEQVKDEHPTRKTQAGYTSRGGHRR
ncbi:MAG TPA: hypothetical protein VFO52_11710 [Longimicrobiales bacterium]|nr:hypothetical protein [Longimicrobiales bacterium]